MSKDPSQITAEARVDDEETVLRQVRVLGTSPAGESLELIRIPPDDSSVDEEDRIADRFVLKKLSRAAIADAEQFQRKFEALRRLDHDSLCPYRELYLGERTARITRHFVDGLTLDEYLLQSITDAESQRLARSADESREFEVHEIDDPGADGESTQNSGDEAPAPDSSKSATTRDESGETPVPDGASQTGPEETDSNPETTSVDSRSEHGDQVTSRNQESEQDHGRGFADGERPDTLEIPASLLEDSGAADRALDLIMLRLRRVIPGLIDAIEYLHRFRQVHGHLRPSNIFVTDDHRVVVTDYGIYPQLQIDDGSWVRHSSYRAPEVDDGEYGPAADLYSLGAILFEALADQPYGAQRADDPADADAHGEPKYLSEIVPHCPATWVDLIHGLLADDPQKRSSLADVHRQLASTETRSVNIPAAVVEEPETLYGRSDRLQELVERSKSTAQNKRLEISIVEGETGVGKTALLDALARRTAQRGWVVLNGRAFRREPIAYQGWEEIVDQMVTIADDLPDKARQRLQENRRRASRLFPQLVDGDERPRISRRDAVDGFCDVLRQLSAQRPLLICFDDLHWAGPDSTRLLADLAEHPDRMRVMIAATWHSHAADDGDEEVTFFDEMQTAPVDVDRMIVEGFSKAEARSYVVTHGADLSLRQKEKVLRRGGLNPLLIDELIHELDDDVEPPMPPPNADSEESGEQVDHRLRSFVVERLQDLDRAERLVLQLLAIASGPLHPRLLARAMEREIGTQTADLVSGREVAESLVEKRMARRARRVEPSGDDTPCYVIVHDLCQSVVLDELGRDHHARLSGLIADALAEGDKNDDLRFEYLLRAGRHREASRAAVLAARIALDRLAYHRATRLFGWLDDRRQIEVRDRPDFVDALMGAGEFERAVDQFDRLEEQSPDLPSTTQLIRRADAELGAGNRSRAVDATDRAMASVSTSYSQRSIADRIAELPRRAAVWLRRWSDAEAIAHSDRPDEAVRERAQLYDFALQHSPVLLTSLHLSLERRFCRLAFSSRHGSLLARDRLRMVGSPWEPFLFRDAAKFDRWLDQADALADQLDDGELRVRTEELRALVARHRGRLGDAVEHLDRSRRLRDEERVDAPLVDTRIARHRIGLAIDGGELDAAVRRSRRLRHRTRHHRCLSALADLAGADADLVAGDLDAAEHKLDAVADFVGPDRNCLLHLWMMDRRTRLLIGRDQSEVAVAEWDLLVDRVYGRRLRHLPPARHLIHLNYARSLAAHTHRRRALGEVHRRTLARLRRHVRRLGDLEPWMGVGDRTRLDLLRSRLALLRDRPDRARRFLQRPCDGDAELPPLLAAMAEEAGGFVECFRENTNGDSRIDHAHRRYDDFGAFLPLVHEGWPVPSSNARLRADP